MVNKRLKILQLYLNTINSYGIICSIKILIFEILGLIFIKDFKSLNYNDEKTSKYNDTKTYRKYDVPYIPTPYYFLYIIKKTLLKFNIKSFKLIDIGCGYCRPAKYLSKNFQISFAGIEINKKIAKEIINEKIRKFKIYNFNIRNSRKIKFFFKKNIKKNINNVIIISDTVEIEQINKIFKKLSYKEKIILIFINVKYQKFKNKFFSIKKILTFKKKSRSIVFFINKKKPKILIN